MQMNSDVFYEKYLSAAEKAMKVLRHELVGRRQTR